MLLLLLLPLLLLLLLPAREEGGDVGLTSRAGAQASTCGVGGGNWPVLCCGRPAVWAGGRTGRVGMVV